MLMLGGGVFTGQGLGYIPGSFMTGQLFWAVVGIAMLATGVVILLVAARRGGPGAG
jgi:hypothetical protein